MRFLQFDSDRKRSINGWESMLLSNDRKVHIQFFTAFFNCFPALKAGTFPAGIVIDSPVCGNCEKRTLRFLYNEIKDRMNAFPCGNTKTLNNPLIRAFKGCEVNCPIEKGR